MDNRSFASFKLNDQLFGLDILQIREINRTLNLTPVPHAMVYFRGLVNLRGQIVAVLDLKRRLGMEDTEITDTSHNIILKTDMELSAIADLDGEENRHFSIPDKVGLLVDAIGDVITVHSSEINPSPANIGEIDAEYLLGVIKLENSLLAVLNLQRVLEI